MQHLLSHQVPIRQREVAKFGHQRAVATEGNYTIIPVAEEAGALLALTAEASFNSAHKQRLAHLPELKELAAEYFEAYFDQVVAGHKPQMDSLLEQYIIESCGGTRAGDYFIQSMHSIANELLAHQQSTGEFAVRSR